MYWVHIYKWIRRIFSSKWIVFHFIHFRQPSVLFFFSSFLFVRLFSLDSLHTFRAAWPYSSFLLVFLHLFHYLYLLSIQCFIFHVHILVSRRVLIVTKFPRLNLLLTRGRFTMRMIDTAITRNDPLLLALAIFSTKVIRSPVRLLRLPAVHDRFHT